MQTVSVAAMLPCRSALDVGDRWEKLCERKSDDRSSSVSVSTLTESQIKERIATMQSMISDHKKELFAKCYDLAG